MSSSRHTKHSNAGTGATLQIPQATLSDLRVCLQRRAQQWSGQTFSLRYDAHTNERGEVLDVKLRETTMGDAEIEECMTVAIKHMVIPEQALRMHSSQPFSGGESMKRERRGPLGDSESQNPLVWVLAGVVEAVEIETVVEVVVGVIAAIGTIVTTKDPKDRCRDHYAACMDTNFGNQYTHPGNVKGITRCATCQKVCLENGGNWPMSVPGMGTRSCKYPGWEYL